MGRDQTDGPTDAVDDEPEPYFEELAAGTLDNADIRPDNHIRNQLIDAPLKAPVEPREVVYDIERKKCQTIWHQWLSIMIN